MKQIISYSSALIVLVISVLLAFFAFIFRTEELNFLAKSQNLSFDSYNDASEKGNSMVSLLVDSGRSIQMTYVLDTAYEYPFTGFYIESKKDSDFLDLSSYTTLNITIKSTKAKKIPIALNVFCPSVSQRGKADTYVSFVYYVDYDSKRSNYEISLEKFTIPNWWFKDHGIADASALNCGFRYVKSVNIESCAFIKPLTKDVIKVENIKLVHRSSWYFVILGFGSLLSILLFVRTYIKQKKTVFVPYKSTPENLRKGLSTEMQLMDFISNNYSNPNLSVAVMCKETGTTESKIASIIKQETGSNFKQYLNSIRLSEAKLLLQESNLSISEIAYRVGYNNVTHFNRVFKSETNSSPGDFRLLK